MKKRSNFVIDIKKVGEKHFVFLLLDNSLKGVNIRSGSLHLQLRCVSCARNVYL